MTDTVDGAAPVAVFEDSLVDLSAVLHLTRWPVDADHWAYRLRFDPVFALEMRLCQEYRITHSQFMGWDETDRAKALGHALFEGRRCQGCGIHPDDWDPDAYPPPYEVATRTCPGCADLAAFQRHAQAQTSKTPSLSDGVKPYLRPRVG